MVYAVNNNVRTLESTNFGGGRINKTDNNMYDINYFITDHLGSTRVIINNAGNIKAQYNYYPFGKQWEDPNLMANTNRYTFSGKEKQTVKDLGWLDFTARMYANSEVPMFTTQDPLSEKYYSLSPYMYCAGNPVNRIDPDGMSYDWYEATEQNNNNTRSVFWKEGNTLTINIDGVEYRNIGANFSYREGNTTYSFEQNEVVSLEEHVLDSENWQTSQTTPKIQCFDATEGMIETSGATVLRGGAVNGIVTGEESGNPYTVTSTGNTNAAVSYIDSQIDQGRSVAVGVDYKQGSPNNDNITDHWVAISARVTNVRTGATSYRFYDPGTSHSTKGTHSSNIFSLQNGMLKGTTYYKKDSSNPNYIVTQVRKNK
jgi:RHS repeat-associated protein